MKQRLKRLPDRVRGLIRLCRDVSYSRNVNAYLVGGFVRDLFLKRENFDLDVVVESDGIAFAEELATRLHGRLTRHRRFGTATITHSHLHKIDVSTCRKEFYPASADLPVVSPGTLRDDLFRRDFTINAMAIQLSGRGFGVRIDYFEGHEDLKRKVIRVLHRNSFIDDPTRILRAIRFQQRFGFCLAPATGILLKRAVSAGMLLKVHPHRVRDDLILLLKEKKPLGCVQKIEQLAGWGFLSTQIKISAKTRCFLRMVSREAAWCNTRSTARKPLEEWLVYLMGILDALTVSQVRRLSRKLALRKDEERRLIGFKQFERKGIRGLMKENILPASLWKVLAPLSSEELIAVKSKYRDCRVQDDIRGLLVHSFFAPSIQSANCFTSLASSFGSEASILRTIGSCSRPMTSDI
ncbi:MAG: hypothetical protein KKC84_00040, partial [Candidatus Omnitrophica bacterium]|nr:hypothetical protein [Candidatus Omnitrophota bacterium]